MQDQSINKALDPVTPLYDTWGGKKYAGSWMIELSFNFTPLSTLEINSWYINTMTQKLETFSELARVWKVSFSSSSESETRGVVLEWQSGTSYEEYLINILEGIKAYPAAIEELAMQIDLNVFVRTQKSPSKPIREWVRHLGELYIRGGLEFGDPYLSFSMNHTLFYPFSYIDGKDNEELFLLNQPLLENALRRWEEQFGEISEVEGLPGIYKYGFLPDKEWDKS
jgi:hypothetical protein